jgi:hypothetical protein
MRRQQRAARARRLRLLAVVTFVALAVAALGLWILLHDPGSAAAHASGVY